MSSPAITTILDRIGPIKFDSELVSVLTLANATASGSDLSGANVLEQVLDRLSSIKSTLLYARVSRNLAEYEKDYGGISTTFI
jgi:hypothetical protein